MQFHFNYQRYAILSIVAILLAVTLYVVALISSRLLQWRRLVHRKNIFLELTPPAHTARTPQATQDLFTVIHGFRASRTVKQKLLRCNVVLSFEKASTRAQGIRYIVRVDEQLAASLRQAITTYLPQIRVAEVSDKLPGDMQIVEFKLTGHYAFPLATARSLEDRDLVAYLAGAMTNLTADEQMRVQIVVTPVRLKEATALARRILGNEDLLARLNTKKLPFSIGVGKFISDGLFAITDGIGEVYHGPTKQSAYNSSSSSARSRYEKLQVSTRQRPARTLSAFELELMETMHIKLNQPLFRVSIRVGVKMDSPDEARARLAAIKNSLQAYSVPSYQALHAKLNNPFVRKLRGFAFSRRLPALFARHSIVLSASELASIYHFPLGNTAQTDNLITSLSRTLPAPVSLKQEKAMSIIIGTSQHHGESTPIGLTEQDRERHVYIIGGTGNGKTTMLQYAIAQDMKNAKGIAVIDPHGDMALTMLAHVPKERIEDVVYFNPDDVRYPVGMNLLEVPEGLSEDELVREKDLVTETVISVFRKIFSEEDSGGHRIEYVLRNAIQTALTVKDATIFTVFDLINDPVYRNKVIAKLKNKDLINFWKNELGKAGEMQKVKMSAGITAKIGRFLFSASAKRVLEQPKSTIDFDDIINSGKILICNFSKGLLGEDTSELFGITVLAKLQLASLRRARVTQAERRPFYLYVDEFQNFATQSFVQMLSESRKYKLFLTMAEQSTSQQKDQQMVQIILANVGTVICFRTGNPADEKLLLPLFSPSISEGEISNQPPFNFYARLASTLSQEPLSGETIVLTDTGDELIAEAVIQRSRELYATEVELEAQQEQIVIKKDTKKADSSEAARSKDTEDNKDDEDDGTSVNPEQVLDPA